MGMRLFGKRIIAKTAALAVAITFGCQFIAPAKYLPEALAPAKAEAFSLGGFIGDLLMGAARHTVILCTTRAMICRLQAYNEAVALTHDPAFERTASNEAVLAAMRNTASAGSNVNLAALQEETDKLRIVDGAEIDKRLQGLDANDAVVREKMINIGKLIGQADHWSGIAYAETAALYLSRDSSDRNLAIVASVIIGVERGIAERLSPVHKRIKTLIPRKEMHMSKKEIKQLGKEITKE